MNGDARLSYSGDFGRWQGEQTLAEGGVLLIWMPNDTFESYVQWVLHLEGVAAPTQNERQTALRHCQGFVYWLELAKFLRDPHVSMRVLGARAAGNYQREMMHSDTLQWNAVLRCWVGSNVQGTLWVPNASFQREENRVVRGYLAHPDCAQASPAQYQDATDTVAQTRYWDAIGDPEVLRLLPGEVPYASK